VKYRNSIDISEILYQFKESRKTVGKGVRKNKKKHNRSEHVQTTLNYHRNSYGTVMVPPQATIG